MMGWSSALHAPIEAPPVNSAAWEGTRRGETANLLCPEDPLRERPDLACEEWFGSSGVDW